MKAILISIKPKWVAKILNGEKTIEIRKTMPKCELPIDVYIYCTKNSKEYLYYDWNKDIYGTTNLKDLKNGWSRVCSSADRIRAYQGNNNILTNGHIVAKFTLNKVEEIMMKKTIGVPVRFTRTLPEKDLCIATCLTPYDLDDYLGNKLGYSWHIDNLVIFDRPRELSEFKKNNSTGNCWKCKLFGSGCSTCQLTKAPQSYMFVEVD